MRILENQDGGKDKIIIKNRKLFVLMESNYSMLYATI